MSADEEFSISLTTETGLVIKQSFEPSCLIFFPLLFFIPAEFSANYMLNCETRVMVGYICVWKACAGRRPGLTDRCNTDSGQPLPRERLS